MKLNQPTYEVEEIDTQTAYNEAVLIGLRTTWGIKIDSIRERFGEEYEAHFKSELAALVNKEWIQEEAGAVKLSNSGKLFADHIASSLFKVGAE
ncbi:MAG: hypothetical protein AAF191_17065 [Verrucomicrobiota bacterium]